MAAQRPGLTQALGRMSEPMQLSALEAKHNAYDVFVFTLEALASPAERQCELMGDYNTAWELRDDALAARYLIGSGLFTDHQETELLKFIATVDPISVNNMPSGSGRTVNLAAMQDPVWESIRSQAQQLLCTLAPVTAANQAYLESLKSAP